MMTIEKSAKTKEEAIALALEELGIEEDQAEIEVVDEGSKGFLGLGSKDACVKVTYNPDEEKRAQEIRPFKKIDDSFKKIIITKDIVPPFYDENGILTMNIYDFLMDTNSIK